MSDKIVEFRVEFVHWDENPAYDETEGPVMCAFCEEQPVEWWCDFLGEGYCKKCMEEQKQEYSERERRMDE